MITTLTFILKNCFFYLFENLNITIFFTDLLILLFIIIIISFFISIKKLIPLIYFLIPYIFYLNFNSINLNLNIFVIIFIIHIFISLPLLIIHNYFFYEDNNELNYYLNYPKNPKSTLIIQHDYILTLGSPKFYLSLGIGLLYPYIFGVILLTIRYLAMGKIIDVSFLFSDITLRVGFVCLCYLPVIIWIINKILRFYLLVKIILWNNFTLALYPIYLFLLNYSKRFFKIAKNFYLFINICNMYLSRIYGDNKRPSQTFFLRYFIGYIKAKPYIWSIFSLLLILLEILLTKQIHWGLYPLFWVILIRGICSNLFSYIRTHFGMDVCRANYLYKNFDPYIPFYFWYHFSEGAPVLWGLRHIFTEEESEIIIKKMKEYKNKWTIEEKLDPLEANNRINKFSKKRLSFKKYLLLHLRISRWI